jgi:uncharacterized membrane protein
VAALYVVLILLDLSFSFGSVQLRMAEILVVLILINYRLFPGLLLGCIVSNFFSPFGLMDVLIGGSATAITLGLMLLIKYPPVALLLPSLVNGAIIGLEIYFLFDQSMALWLLMGAIALGEFLVTYVAGLPVYYLIYKNKAIRQLLQAPEKSDAV